MTDRYDDGLLTADESEALLAAMREGIAPEKTAEPFRVGAADAPLRRVVRRAEGITARLTAALRDDVLRTTRATLETRDGGVEVVTANEGLGASDPSACWSLSRAGVEVGVISIGTKFARFVLERRLGTPAALLRERGRDSRPLSALERRMVESLARALADALTAAALVSGPLEVGPAPTWLEDDARRAAPVMRFGLDVELGEGETEPTRVLLLPAAFEPAPGAGGDARMAERLPDVDVDLVAVLGRASATVRGLLALGVGDVVRLDGDPNRPVPIQVDDVTVMRGSPRVVSGNLAVEIVHHLAPRVREQEKGKVA